MPIINEELKLKLQKRKQNLKELIQKRQSYESLNSNEIPPGCETSINFPDVHGLLLLHYSCALGEEEAVTDLLKQKASINMRTLISGKAIGITPLHMALEFEHRNIAIQLIAHGADESLVPITKTTPMWFKENFIKKGQEKLKTLYAKTSTINLIIPDDLKPLLYLSAQIDEVNDMNKIPSVSERHKEVYNYTLENYSNEFLLSAAKNGSLEFCKTLVANNAPIMPIVKTEKSAAHYALLFSHWEITEFFLDSGLDLNQQDCDGNSLLHSATLGKNIEYIKKLLLKDINTSISNSYQENFLHLLLDSDFSEESVYEILSIINKNSLNTLLNQENIFGITPLQSLDKNYSQLISSLGIKKELLINLLQKEYAINVNQTKIMEKMYFFIKLNRKNINEFSQNGYCIGYSVLLQLLGEKRFDEITHLIISWDGTEEMLETSIENFMSLRNLIDLFIRCITWAQHPWIATNDHLNFEKILQALGIDYQIISDIDLNTSDSNLTKQYFEIFSKFPQNTSLLLLGDGHACSARISENLEISYNDPNFIYKLNPFKTIDKLIKILEETKFRKSIIGKNGSSTRMLIFVHNENVQTFNNNKEQYIEQLENLKMFSTEKISSISNMNSSLFNLPCYSEEEKYNSPENKPELSRLASPQTTPTLNI